MTAYKNKNPLQLRIFCFGMLLTLGLGTTAQAEVKNFQIHGEITPFAEDGIHDPENDAIEVFQHPTTAMKDFPRDTVGVVDWVKALEEGKLIARSNRLGTEEQKTFDLDIIRTNTGEMPNVIFSHAKHSTQIDCKSCHSGLFEEKSNTTEITMSAILTGDKCGVCHGKVAFPPTNNCMRCHNEAP